MIKPNELRDNILVQLLSTPKPVKIPTGIVKVVKLIDSEFELFNIDKPICSQESSIKLDLNIINGIPITEEWLLKFGFDYNEYEKSYDIMCVDELVLAYYFRDTGSPVVLCEAPYHIGVVVDAIRIERIKYIHQLQNLYFSLTGEELTIKE